MKIKNHEFKCKPLESIAERLISRHFLGEDCGPNAYAKKRAWQMFEEIDRGAASAHKQIDLHKICEDLSKHILNDPPS